VSIKQRVEQLEQRHGRDMQRSCILLAGNIFGLGTEEDQLAVWRQRNPGIEPAIFRIRFVEMKSDNLSRESTRCV
jgi:hypothetical protein